jgi:hypothetical protein
VDPDAAVTALEAAISDVGALLLRLQKFRAGAAAHAELLAATSLLGDRARMYHRRDTLDAANARALARDAEDLRERASQALTRIFASEAYRTAAAAHAAGDAPTLARILPALFAGLEHVAEAPTVYASVPWLRRNRPRPADDVAASVARVRDDGLPGDGDPAAPGVDPELPAVSLLADAPAGDPIVLRIAGSSLPPLVFRLVDADEYLVHIASLRTPFDVVLPATLDPDELGEISLDHPAYRAALRVALAATGIAAVDA